MTIFESDRRYEQYGLALFYSLLRQMAAKHTDVQTVIYSIQLWPIHKLNKEIQRWYNTNHKSTDEFQISSLTELFNIFGDSTLYKLLTAMKAWYMWRDNDCRTTQSQQYNFLQNTENRNLRWCKSMILAVCDKNIAVVLRSLSTSKKNTSETVVPCYWDILHITIVQVPNLTTIQQCW